MVEVERILPTPISEDVQIDYGVKVRTPWGSEQGMILVRSYAIGEDKVAKIYYWRDVPFRPYIGDAGTVHHPWVISRIVLF